MTGIYHQRRKRTRTKPEPSCIYIHICGYHPRAESSPPGRKRSAGDVNGAVRRLNLNGGGNCGNGGNGGNATGVEPETAAAAAKADGTRRTWGVPVAGVAGARARGCSRTRPVAPDNGRCASAAFFPRQRKAASPPPPPGRRSIRPERSDRVVPCARRPSVSVVARERVTPHAPQHSVARR